MIPSEKELLAFLQRHDLVNFSAIAKQFGLQNATVADIMKDLQKKKLVDIRQVGGSKIVLLKKRKP